MQESGDSRAGSIQYSLYFISVENTLNIQASGLRRFLPALGRLERIPLTWPEVGLTILPV